MNDTNRLGAQDMPSPQGKKRKKAVVKLSFLVILLLAVGLLLFGISKCSEQKGIREFERMQAKLEPFSRASRSFAVLLDYTWYFSTHEVNVRKVLEPFGDFQSISTAMTKDAIFIGGFEKQSRTADHPYRFVVFRCDLHGKRVTEVYSVEGDFFNKSALWETRDTFLFTYNEQRNNKSTRQLVCYDVSTDEVSTTAIGAELDVQEAADRQQELEQADHAWSVDWREDAFVFANGTVTDTVPREFFKGTIFETVFADENIWKTTAYARQDAVVLTVWFPCTTAGCTTVSFLYMPTTQQMELLSCIHLYDAAITRMLLLD